MKILHVCKKYPAAIGGDAVVVANLQKQQVAAKHQVAIVTSNCDAISDGSGIYKIGLKDTPASLDAITIKRIISLVILFFRMFAILRSERPDVIHTHSVDMAYIASFAARRYHIPIVHTFHIVTFYDTSQSVLRRKSELWLAKRAQPRFVTAPNSYDVEKLRQAGLSQAVLLPNGVDLEFWKPPAHSRKNKTFVFLAVGRLEPQKGYEYLIKAALLLSQKTDAAFRIIIVGEGSQKKALHELVQDLKLQNIVEFAGGKSPEQTRTLLGQADAITCPSLYETTPLTLLEAWSSMVPVIMTPVGILRDTPTDFTGAFLVQPKNELSLMHAMATCIHDSAARQNVIAKGYEEVKKYAWPLVGKIAEAFYQTAPTKQTRIVQVSSYYPPHLGGQENAVLGLARQLAKARHDVHILTSTNGGGTPGESDENGVQVHRMRSLIFGHAPIMPWFPIALFRAAKPGSIVHLHIGQAFTPEIVWLVSKLRGFKYVAQLHIDFKASGPAGVLLPLYKKFVLKRVLQSAAAVVTLNHKTHQIVREAYQYTGKSVVMNNGLDDDFFEIQRKPLAAQPPKALRLLFVGRFSKQKNISTLLQACADTPRQIHLDVVGDGDERPDVLAAIKTLKLKNVTLHGRLGRKEVMKLYATCDALVMPSLYEAQPLVLLEAMAARIPIIGTRVIGVEDHIKDAGILTEPTVRGLVNAFEQYYTSYHLLPAMIKKGAAIAEKLRWSHTLNQYEALYEETMAR